MDVYSSVILYMCFAKYTLCDVKSISQFRYIYHSFCLVLDFYFAIATRLLCLLYVLPICRLPAVF